MSGSDVSSKNFSIVSSYLLVACGVIVLTWYIQWLWRRRHMYIYSWNIPGPFALPFIGAGYLFIFSTTCGHQSPDLLIQDWDVPRAGAAAFNILENILRVQENYPEIAAIWLGPKLAIGVGKPEYVEKILTSSKALNKSSFYKFLNFAVGEGLLTAKAQKWKKHRKIIMPAFNQRILNMFQEIFEKRAEILVDQLEKQIGNKNIDFFEMISNCTLDIICETALGVDMNLQICNSDFPKNLDRVMEITTYRIFRLWHHLVFTWNWYPLSKEFDKALGICKNFTGTVIREKLEVYNNKQSSEDCIASANEKGSSEQLAFLDLILENGNFTELELREEVDIFLAAGSDTTASTLSCIFTILGMFQDVQQKVLEEILEIVGPDRRVLSCDLPEMKYTDRVIKESLRLFPVAAFFSRTIAEDIDAGDIVFPAGSEVFFGCLHIHRNPKYWTDPLKFDPDRFLPENVAKRHPCTYIPFSYGPRNCVGGKYAIINMKTILATVLRRFKIYTEYKTIEEIKLKVNLVLRMKDGPKVWVESR